jgi:hypothetical protein
MRRNHCGCEVVRSGRTGPAVLWSPEIETKVMIVKRILLVALLLAAVPAVAQTAAPSTPAQDEQLVLTRGVLEAMRANTEALRKTNAAIDALAGQLSRVETATRAVPPSVEGLRTDVVAIRALVDRLAQASRRPAATLRFSPFACGNDNEASCATNACKSVGYSAGALVTPVRTGTGSSMRTTGIAEATCFDN